MMIANSDPTQSINQSISYVGLGVAGGPRHDLRYFITPKKWSGHLESPATTELEHMNTA